jgi:uncharacterized protein (UPF0332 family)
MIKESADRTLHFRIEQSHEKLMLSKQLIGKGEYSGAILQAYLSIFYSVRSLLLDTDNDSDDINKIIDLSKKYYQPSGWTNINIPSILEEGHAYSIRNSNVDDQAHKSDAERFVKSAEQLYNEITGSH